MPNSMDYLSQYDLEKYLFESVSSRFRNDGYLYAYDFFCIIIWKANRAKTKIAKRLMEYSSFSNLDEAAFELTKGIGEAIDHKERLRYLMKEWGFQLPMATAILTVLYPDDFTVYDIRVCDELKDYHRLKNLFKFESIWSNYLDYKNKVISETPQGLSLRDKDRYLWGKSFSKQLEYDIQITFNR